MKKVSILKYDLKGVSVIKKTLIHRALYGYTDHSNKGDYTYNRKGVLNGIKYKKISNSVLLLNTKEIKQIAPLFRKYRIKTRVVHLLMP